MLYRLAEMLRAGVVCGMSFYSAFPMVDRREMYFHVPRCGSLKYTGRFSPRSAKHIHHFKSLLHFSPLPF
jgi:hypothetical protein